MHIKIDGELNRSFYSWLSDHGTNAERILAQVWLDADNGDWPKENAGQRKAWVDTAIMEIYQCK